MKRKHSESDQTVLLDASSLLESSALPRAAQLVVVEGPTPGQTLAIETPVTRIGRRDGSEFILDSQGVSRDHATIVHEAESYYVIDVGAANGVFVNGKKLTPGQRECLSHGDSLLVGNVRILFLNPHASGSTINSSGVVDIERQKRHAEADSWIKRVYAIDPLAEND